LRLGRHRIPISLLIVIHLPTPLFMLFIKICR
jgi:hypothetical protein